MEGRGERLLDRRKAGTDGCWRDGRQGRKWTGQTKGKAGTVGAGEREGRNRTILEKGKKGGRIMSYGKSREAREFEIKGDRVGKGKEESMKEREAEGKGTRLGSFRRVRV